MSECESVQESIGRWLDGEMPPSESESVRAHVARCNDCGEARRRLEKMQSALKSVLAAETAPIEFMPFWRAVERRINEKRAWYEDWLERARGLFTAPRLAWAVPVAIGGTDFLIPQAPGPDPIYLTLLSSMFMHGSWLHLGGNMLFLWIFGDNVEHRAGPFLFLVAYLAAGIVGSMA